MTDNDDDDGMFLIFDRSVLYGERKLPSPPKVPVIREEEAYPVSAASDYQKVANGN